MTSPEHDALVARAVRWLATTMRCGVVLAEPRSSRSTESPDAIGWSAGGAVSHVVEVKVSLRDYVRDVEKPHRLNGFGAGRLRWFLTPPGLLGLRDDLPVGWGMLEAEPRRIRILRPAVARAELPDLHEVQLMYSSLWKAARGMPLKGAEIAEHEFEVCPGCATASGMVSIGLELPHVCLQPGCACLAPASHRRTRAEADAACRELRGLAS